MSATINTKACDGCLYQGDDNRCHRYPSVVSMPAHLRHDGEWMWDEWRPPCRAALRRVSGRALRRRQPLHEGGRDAMTDQEIVERYKRGGIGLVGLAREADTSQTWVAWLLGAAGVPLRKQGDRGDAAKSIAPHLSRLKRHRAGMALEAIAAEDGVTRQAVYQSVQKAALHLLMEAP